MNKVIEYRIVDLGLKHHLEKTVNDWIRLGWIPIGGVTFIESHFPGGSDSWIQAMVRYES
jgi:hypothetical protein